MPEQPPNNLEPLSSGPRALPPTQSKPDDTFEAEKKRLELLKLDLEIAQIREPWYKKPVYLGVMIPSFLAFATLMIGIATGYFRNQSEIIQLRAEKAGLEAAKFEDEKKALAAEKGKLSGEIVSLEQRKQELDQLSLKNQLAYNAERQKLAEELQRLANERTITLAEADEKRRQLEEKGRELDATYQAKKAAVDTAIANMEGEVARLRDEQLVRSLGEKLEIIKIGESFSKDVKAAANIYKIVSDDEVNAPKYISFLEKTVSDARLASGPRAYTLFLLYSLTREPKWKHNLFSLMRREASMADDQVWQAFWEPSPGWSSRSDDERLEFTNLFVELSHSPAMDDRPTKLRLVRTIYEISAGNIINPRNPKTSSAYFDIVDLSISVAADYDDIHAFLLLTRFAREAYIVLVARCADTRLCPGRNKDSLAVLRSLIGRRDFFPAKLLAQLNVDLDSENDEDWIRWLKEHKDREVLWMEPGLKRLRRDPTLLSEYK